MQQKIVSVYDQEIPQSQTAKPVFRVSDKIIPKPAFSATETRLNSKISLGASFDMILFNK